MSLPSLPATIQDVTLPPIIPEPSRLAIIGFCGRSKIPIPDKDDDNIWRWQTQEGNFTKRISKFASKLNVQITPQQLSHIGNLAKSQWSDQTFNINITNDFNWKPGTYGDKNSCYWEDNTAARVVIKHAGGLAALFHEKDKPLGRSFLLPYKDIGWAIFNSMGTGINNDLAANLLAHATDLAVMKINRSNSDSYDGVLYFNDNSGPILFQQHNKKYIDLNHLFGINTKELPSYVTCSQCYKPILKKQAIKTVDINTVDNRKYRKDFYTCPACHAPENFQ